MKLFFFVLFSALVITNQAQVSGQNESYLVSGIVADSANNPLNDALVTLYLFHDSTAIATALTTSDGGFEIQIANPEKYFLSIAALGYQSYFSQVIEVKTLKTKYVLPIINLRATGSSQLESVEIISKKPFVEQSIDRIIVHPEALISNAGTTALDVLEKSPGVQVDMDGNISLKGKGVMVYVDDKPTYLAPADLAGYLRSLPSESLENIEIMTNPPAKYDAAGTGGIININIKKTKRLVLTVDLI